ncbi:MAG TPA: hypothetical protein VER76_17965 [Pyrinomonadaceae bacterium]|nr:hypothetical protein [Pyrinomonadaceae bacterium]
MEASLSLLAVLNLLGSAQALLLALALLGLPRRDGVANRVRAVPFAHVLAGGALFRGFASSRTQAGNTFLIDDAQSFALAVGGGLDVRAGKHFDIRVFQADYLPTFFGSTRQDNLRLSFGVVFKR